MSFVKRAHTAKTLGSGALQFLKLFLVMAVICTVLGVTPGLASAGTLTSNSWSVMDPRTSIPGNRYDWNFTTATSSAVSRVNMAVPVGTTGPNRYLALPGVVSNYISAPDSTNNSQTGDFDIRMKANLASWSPASQMALYGKDATFRLYLNAGGTLGLVWLDSTATSYTRNSTVAVPFAANTTGWVRVVFQYTVAGNHVWNYYTSTDGTNWTALGTQQTLSGTNAGVDTTNSLIIGAKGDGSLPVNGKVYYADERSNATAGTTSASTCDQTAVVVCFNPSNDTIGGSSWVAPYTGETWTNNVNGTGLQSDVGSDLSVVNATGIAGGGQAILREIAHIATYTPPSAATIGAGVAVSIGLAGFTNTYTAGANTSAITTYDATPTAVDTATAAAVTFTVPIITTAGGTKQIISTATPLAGTSVDMLPYGLALSGNNLYIADDYGAFVFSHDITNGNTLRVAGNGIASAPTSGSTAATQPLGGNNGSNYAIAVDGSSNVYITDGTAIYKITNSTGIITKYAGTPGTNSYSGDSGAAVSATFSGISGLYADAAGDLWVADTLNSRIRYIDHTGSNTVSTLTGDGTATNNGDTGAASSAEVNKPTGVFVDASGNVFLSTLNTIRKITFGTNIISTVAGNNSTGYTGDGAAATSATFRTINGLTLDTSGNIYIADSGNQAIRKVTQSTGFVSTVAGNGTQGYTGDGGIGTSAKVSYPTSPVVDSSGNVYFADDFNSRVRKIAASNGFITTEAGTGVSAYAGDGGNLANARFNEPQGIASYNNSLYVADVQNQAIRQIDQWGNTSTYAGVGLLTGKQAWSGGGFSGDGGAATAATFSYPSAVAFASDGTMYISDKYNNKIRKVTPAGVISTLYSASSTVRGLTVNPVSGDIFAALGNCQIIDVTTGGSASVYANSGATCANAADGSTASSATLNVPDDIYIDPNGVVYFTEYSNNRVRKILNGVLVTVAGGGGSSADNVAATTEALSAPTGITRDSLGNFYISDLSRIRKFTDGGPIFTIAGNATPGFSGDGGAATTANLSYEEGNFGRKVAFVNGQLYLTDALVGRIRKVADVAPIAPQVNADSFTTAMNTARSWPILSNDWSENTEMDPTSVSVVTPPTHGTVTLTVPTGDATTLQANYTPTTSYTGSDSFTYTACDNTKVLCANATVTITVASDQVTSVAGGLAEGLAGSIGFQAQRVTRFKNYLFVYDATKTYLSTAYQVSYSNIRRYDIYSKQLVVVAGNGTNANGGDGGPASAASISGGDMAFAPDGTLYIADGTNNRVRQVSTSGTITTVAGTGTAGTPTNGTAATAALLTAPPSVAFDAAGNLHVISGSQLWKFPIGGNMTLVAGSGTAGSTGDGGSATAAQMNLPSDLVFNSAGDIYISDTGNNAIRRVRGGLLTTVAGTLGTPGSTGNGGLATAALLSAPAGISIDPAGNLYVADSGNNVIRLFFDGSTISLLNGGGITSVQDVAFGASGALVYAVSTTSYRLFSVSIPGASRLNLSNSAGFLQPFSPDGINSLQTQIAGNTNTNGAPFAVDPSGNIYFAGPGSRIRKFDPVAKVASTVVGDGTFGNDSTHVGSVLAGMAFDPSGRLVFADVLNNEIRRVELNNTITTLAGNTTYSFTGDGGLATAATMKAPLAVTVDQSGNVYFTDGGAFRIRKITASTGIITTVAGNGTSATTGDGGLATSASITGNDPALATDTGGNLYIDDKNSSEIRVVDRNGIINTVAGTGTQSFTGDGGLATAAGLNNPSGMVLDADGNIFISDTSNSRIRKVTAATGIITTVAGTGSNSVPTDAATLAAAVTPAPRSLALSNGNLYFFGDNFNKVRMIKAFTATATNSLAAASWAVAPPATGHTNLREELTVTPAVTAASSKMTFLLPTSFAGTPSAVETFGLTGTVTPAISGNTLTLGYTSQTLSVGVPIAISLEGISNGGSNGNYNSNVTEYDSPGTTAIGWATTNVFKLSASGAPASGQPGFASVWQPSMSATLSSPTVALALDPSATADVSIPDTFITSGNLNGNVIKASAGVPTGVPGTLTGITADQTTSVASASFAANRWGVQVTSSTGTNAGATGAGFYSGLGTTPGNVVTNAASTATITFIPRAKVDWLTAAGRYNSTFTFSVGGGG